MNISSMFVVVILYIDLRWYWGLGFLNLRRLFADCQSLRALRSWCAEHGLALENSSCGGEAQSRDSYRDGVMRSKAVC